MTEFGGMEGGREEGASPTTDQIARAVAREAISDGRDVATVLVQRITDGLFAVSITVHGENAPESFFYRVDEDEVVPG